MSAHLKSEGSHPLPATPPPFASRMSACLSNPVRPCVASSRLLGKRRSDLIAPELVHGLSCKDPPTHGCAISVEFFFSKEAVGWVLLVTLYFTTARWLKVFSAVQTVSQSSPSTSYTWCWKEPRTHSPRPWLDSLKLRLTQSHLQHIEEHRRRLFLLPILSGWSVTEMHHPSICMPWGIYICPNLRSRNLRAPREVFNLDAISNR